jgi:hypothetical protein
MVIIFDFNVIDIPEESWWAARACAADIGNTDTCLQQAVPE